MDVGAWNFFMIRVVLPFHLRNLARVEGEVELELAALVDDRVAGVVAALESDDEVRLLREEVGDLSLAFVAPLRADDRGDRHVFRC